MKINTKKEKTSKDSMCQSFTAVLSSQEAEPARHPETKTETDGQRGGGRNRAERL